MKTIKLTLDEKTVNWVRIRATRRDMSPSSFIGELLHREMQASDEYAAAMQRYLGKKPVELKRAGASYPVREDVNNR